MVENWKRREAIIEYCVGVVDRSVEEKRTALEQDPNAADERVQRRIRGEMYAQETKVHFADMMVYVSPRLTDL